MNDVVVVIAVLAGVLLGAVAAWLVLRARVAAAVAAARADLQTQVAALGERVSAREAQVSDLQTAAARAGEQTQQLLGNLQQQAALRAAAEEKGNRVPQLEAELRVRDERFAAVQQEGVELKKALAEMQIALSKERKAAEEKLALLEQAKINLSDAFSALAAEALKSNNRSFLDLARQNLEAFQHQAKGDLAQRQEAIKTLVEPLKQQLETYQQRLQQAEAAQSSTLGEVKKQLETLGQQSQSLARETQQFRIVLKSNQARGRWGEETLRRVIEAAGMSAHCDFTEQAQAGEGKPDLIVRLPGDRVIIVDAKVPDLDFLTALENADPIKRAEDLAAHAARLKATIKALAERDYPSQFPNALDHVVLFLPAESLFSAALEGDRDLIVWAAARRILLATPASLIALLRSVSVSWQQHAQTQNAQEIANAARELYARIFKFSEHLEKIRAGLERANAAFNEATASFQSRVRPAGQRLTELSGGAGGKDLPQIDLLENVPRLPASTSPRIGL